MSTTPITEHLIAQLRERAERGRAKYGTTLDREDLGLGQWAQHAIEEALDLAGYLEAARRRARQDARRLRELEGELARYRLLCGMAYQAAGAYGLPTRFLDALGDGATGEWDRWSGADLLPCDPPGDWRFWVNGPDLSFATDSSEDAERILAGLGVDRDDFTVTDSHEPGVDFPMPPKEAADG